MEIRKTDKEKIRGFDWLMTVLERADELWEARDVSTPEEEAQTYHDIFMMIHNCTQNHYHGLMRDWLGVWDKEIEERLRDE